MVITPHKCEGLDMSSPLRPDPEPDVPCNEAAPYLVCYGGGGNQPHTMLWLCEYHMNEHKRKAEEASDAKEG